MMLGFVHPLHAASSVLVWPIYQVIDADQNGSALWLENRGAKPVRLQIRVMAWKQRQQKEAYAEQNLVVASPPFATIAPGKKQLIRLMRTAAVEPGTESAFRIIIDEIPAGNVASGGERAGLTLQMRYLLPLFVNGEGIWSRERSDRPLSASQIAHPVLSWKIATVNGKAYLHVQNRGIVHARLSNVFLGNSSSPDSTALYIARGFLGYVLPGQSMQWPIPDGRNSVSHGLSLFAQLEDNRPAVKLDRAG